MGPSSLRKAIGAVKDQTSISLAKVNNSTSISDLDVAIVKATRHDEHPAEDKYIREIISLTSYSRAFINFCVNTLSRRLNKTKNWTVALKTLILIQRLLAEGDPAYEQEIFFATRRGTRLLNMSDFRDSKSTSWEYSAFVRTYSLYLDDRLEFRMQGKRGKRSAYVVTENVDEEGNPVPPGKTTPVHEMKTDRIFTRIQHLLQLLERFLACRPTGLAKHNRVVIVALYPIVKDSFNMYYDITEILGILIDRFMELEIPDSVKVYEIFVRVAKQFDELDKFYDWCKTVGIARTSEYPEVEMITQKKLELMDDFIRDKSALAQNTRLRSTEPNEVEQEPVKEPEPVEEDMNAIKALPAPEPEPEPVEEPKVEEEPKKEETLMIVQKEADLLNLGDDITTEQHGNNLALALFDMGQPGPTSTGPTITWEAFKDDSTDWETALIQSTSNLAIANAQANVSLPGGFDMLVLDGMYHQGATNAAMNATAASGSASSVAYGSVGRPGSQMLALPAPPSSVEGNGTNAAAFVDPFASSLVVAPPAYVQMSDMEKKQRLLMEEQMGWQQYTRDGMQGQIGFSKLQQQYYNYTGGYAPRY